MSTKPQRGHLSEFPERRRCIAANYFEVHVLHYTGGIRISTPDGFSLRATDGSIDSLESRTTVSRISRPYSSNAPDFVG